VQIDRLDHLVLTVADIDRAVASHRDVLGMEPVVFGGGRTALSSGRSEIDLHRVGREFGPKAARPVAGSADVCLVARDPLEVVSAELRAHGAAVEEGPVERTGATGPIVSVHVRDPDGDLVEISDHRTD
jgi:catechol 2,3-dioxygenase-like lactoylglutathione lyase family enzyme